MIYLALLILLLLTYILCAILVSKCFHAESCWTESHQNVKRGNIALMSIKRGEFGDHFIQLMWSLEVLISNSSVVYIEDWKLEKMVKESKGINRDVTRWVFLIGVFLVDMVMIKGTLLNRMFNVCRLLANVLPFTDHKRDYL